MPKNAKTKTKWRCQKGHVWRAIYHDIQQGNGCPYCANRRPKQEQDYCNLAGKRGFKWVGSNVPKSVMNITKWKCQKGHAWRASYNAIQKGNGCPHCANKYPKQEEDYRILASKREFEWVGGDVPQNTREKTRWRCGKNHVWQAGYSDIQAGYGCPHCAGNLPKQESDYHELASERGFKWVGNKLPRNTATKTKWQCQNGHTWRARYNNIQQGAGCPACNESKGEVAIARLLDMLGIAYTRQPTFEKCKNRRLLPFDFSFDLHGHDGALIHFLVEYDGQQHFEAIDIFGGRSALRGTQRRDRIKNEFAERYGYVLIRIPYTVDDISSHLVEAITKVTGKKP